MQFDLRYAIGTMFTLLGIILVAYGVVANPAIYANTSLGLNINFDWGFVLLAFGLFMLFLAQRARGAAKRKP